MWRVWTEWNGSFYCNREQLQRSRYSNLDRDEGTDDKWCCWWNCLELQQGCFDELHFYGSPGGQTNVIQIYSNFPYCTMLTSIVVISLPNMGWCFKNIYKNTDQGGCTELSGGHPICLLCLPPNSVWLQSHKAALQSGTRYFEPFWDLCCYYCYFTTSRKVIGRWTDLRAQASCAVRTLCQRINYCPSRWHLKTSGLKNLPRNVFEGGHMWLWLCRHIGPVSAVGLQ